MRLDGYIEKSGLSPNTIAPLFIWELYEQKLKSYSTHNKQIYNGNIWKTKMLMISICIHNLSQKYTEPKASSLWPQLHNTKTGLINQKLRPCPGTIAHREIAATQSYISELERITKKEKKFEL